MNMTIRALGQALRSRQLSCVELIDQTFSAIREREAFRSFITLNEEQARQLAAERDRELQSGIDRGPLHGIPTAHKDLFYTRGIRTTGGSLLFRDFVPDSDATVVTKLENAGAISVGKTNLHEVAYGITSKNPHYGAVLNPRDPARIAGGSSGGSAALVAASIVPFSLGTDTGGSIRVPASYCGVTGLKPTFGRVSRHGVLPLSFSLDHVGPLAATAEDCALTMNAIAGPDPLDPGSAPDAVPDFNLPALASFAGVRIGVARDALLDRQDEHVAAQVKLALGKMQRSGAEMTETPLPDLAEVNAAALTVLLAEAAAVYLNHTDPSLFGADVWALLEQGRTIAAHQYIQAKQSRARFRQEMDKLWRKFDILVLPTTPITAPLLTEDSVTVAGQQENVRMATTRLVRALNYLGEPALSVPCGHDAHGLPVGLQLVAAPFEEPKLLQIAKTLEPLLL